MSTRLSVSKPPYIIPSYSLTGDLLAYLNCGLQYRYQNKGSLPPSKPVQLWFGEFIHAVLEESFLRWFQGTGPAQFPWNWDEHIRPIELEIHRRLMARGLYPPYRLFCAYDGDGSSCTCDNPAIQNHKLISSRRTESAINTWSPHLFPLIAEAEIPLQAIRPMPNSANMRSDYYEVTGIVDVLGSVQLTNAPPGNLLLHYLDQNEEIRNAQSKLQQQEYEIILDYKGMRRPSTANPAWQYYEWQVLTYAWLRAQQEESNPVVAGIILFVNELEPSEQDISELADEVGRGTTDVMPYGNDLQGIENWKPRQPPPSLTTTLREQRSIRIVPVDHKAIGRSLGEFDDVVQDIEETILLEMLGRSIRQNWYQRPSGRPYSAPEKRTCTACDFKHYCPLAHHVGEGGDPKAP